MEKERERTSKITMKLNNNHDSILFNGGAISQAQPPVQILTTVQPQGGGRKCKSSCTGRNVVPASHQLGVWFARLGAIIIIIIYYLPDLLNPTVIKSHQLI